MTKLSKRIMPAKLFFSLIMFQLLCNVRAYFVPRDVRRNASLICRTEDLILLLFGFERADT